MRKFNLSENGFKGYSLTTVGNLKTSLIISRLFLSCLPLLGFAKYTNALRINLSWETYNYWDQLPIWWQFSPCLWL